MPADPPMLAKQLSKEELLDEARDWTLAHEEMRLARQLQSATKGQEFTGTQVMELQALDPLWSSEICGAASSSSSCNCTDEEAQN